ncbi:leucyl/phenylalanyl-tRNA--protein transferase [Kitasatospora sp. NPDC057542]|uniref:leucyl/phenylalanyl-tRNA--protein transferase n=1 Tax=Streptomycetaceae TaxID=2062 RepID=UPI001CCE92E7|nr:leucyl/phenylalanyl-tRNA--protein transferase [Streptomyces sp. LS1784]
MPIALGGDLSLETMLKAYRGGVFPFPPSNEHWADWSEEQWGAALDEGRIPVLSPTEPRFALQRWAPGRRAVLTPATARLGSTYRRKLLRTDWTTTLDTVPATVVERCGPGRGKETWLSRDLADAFLRLAGAGVLHTVEVWDEEGELIGGMFGVLTGTVLSVESGFRTQDNVVKVALLDALDRLTTAGGQLLDVQILSPHLAAIGAQEIPKADFHTFLEAGLGTTIELPTERLPVRRLLKAPEGP